ncbi:IkappaB kinase complex IKAP component [Trametes gibbosa]|nr:IkappaB kinase complex IKAP component [Trametes gibbosa]
MRNLALSKTTHTSFPISENSSSAEPSSITAIALDLDQNAFYVTTERKGDTDDIYATINIWKICDAAETSEEGTPSLVTSFQTPAPPIANPLSEGIKKRLTKSKDAEILSLHVLPDSRSLIAITRAGEVHAISLDEDTPSGDVVAYMETGFLAAAWGPDDTLLAIATEDKLFLLTSLFTDHSEGPLYPQEFGEDAPINVGWGAKHTQFHGSLGKAAASASIPPTAVGASPDDDGHVRISWRGDGAYFTLSILEGATEARPHRTVRVYSRDGALQSTAEPVPGLEHTLSWRPSGNLIVATQRFGNIPGEQTLSSGTGLGQGRDDRHDIVFFERNGLRHGEFTLRECVPRDREIIANERRRWGYRVRELGWSSDSNVLAVWLEREDGDIVQLWTSGNYHWYLKHEIVAPEGIDNAPGRFTSVKWHPEDSLRLILTTSSSMIQRTYSWETFGSPSTPPVDSGSVAVIDGANILLTPFRSQNVPPPMASYILAVQVPVELQPVQPGCTPIHAAFASTGDLLAVLWESGLLQIFNLKTRLEPGRGKVMDPVLLWTGSLEPKGYRQVTFARHAAKEGMRLAILGSNPGGDARDIVTILDVAHEEMEKIDVAFVSHNGRLIPSQGIVWEAPDGRIFQADTITKHPSEVAKFPESCFWTAHVHTEDNDDLTPLYIGLSHANKLYIASSNFARTLATNATSFTVTPSFLVFTTTAHMAQFAPWKALLEFLTSPERAPPEFETRRVERGSRIVTAVPSSMSLVLQMPRGNLETINPRPLVMEIVRQDISSGSYLKAFTACRKHRIDLNVFVETNKEAFINGIPSFIDQVSDVDYINLFLTSLGQGPLPSEDVSHICDQVRVELEQKDLKAYVNSILTAHVVKRPPDYEAGLALLLRLKESEPSIVEDAVKYIIFLVDADKLFDTALGMYDFSLVLMVAQHAQKDPREYLPFLRELRALDQHYQRFRIDDHLRLYEKALTHLSEAGPERFDEAIAYVEKHQLCDHALLIWRETDQYKAVLNIYGDWLFERRDFREAAFVFRQANRPEKALIAHEKALDWRELFELALQKDFSAEELKDIAYRVSDDLLSKKRTSEAALVLLDYAKDVRAAVIALVEGSHFSEARRILVLHRHPELIEEIVYPGALECRARISEDMSEMREQLRKQANRLRELRVRKVEEPDAFYGVEDTDLHNVDVMTDISMAPTMFTRYTVAPSAMSKTSSKRSSRSKRKLERKVGSGRKGTVDEEEYLLKSVSKLVTRFNVTQTDGASLLPHLLQFTDEHRVEAASLQQELSGLAEELSEAVEEIWKKAPESEEPSEALRPMDSWAARMEAHEKQKHISPVDKVVKPELARPEWKLQLPDARA